VRTGLLFCILSSPTALLAQPPAAAPAFEVASVKPDSRAKGGGEGSRRETVTPEPGRLTMVNARFTTVIRWAYDVKEYQLKAPAWMDEERYDITAKAADAVPEKDLRLMLQRLLAERFKLEFHRETKDLPVYALVIAKGGPKFHESRSEGEFSVKPVGRTVASVERASVSQLVELLTQVLRMPILDETGLTGKYDITVDMTSYLPDNFEHGSGGPPPDIGGIVMAAVQEQLGLKLESRKAPLDLLVIEHAEKVPTEN
jgi:uncharacterized protein (TIGR03435 family)